MIIKGNRHGNGPKLAAYLLDGGKHGERVTAPELHGFGLHPDDISKAFASLDAIAKTKGIENPLFHIQIRLPQNEQMTPAQWDMTTARAIKTAGLEGQPYARVFHTDEKTGEIHCHLAVSLIDEQTHKAKAVPFYKLRFKALARTLEKEFDLTRVKNHRDSPIKYGATKDEEQQAQRLGFSKEDIRNTIRNCWDRADCGQSFEAELTDMGLILAQGDRGKGNYLVIDPKGGLHVLGKRILDVSAAQVRDRVADLDRDNLPTVESARAFLLDLPRDRIEKLTRELAEINRQLAAEREHIDSARHQNEYDQALERVAIEKEERERRFAEPEKETRAEAAAAKEHEPQREIETPVLAAIRDAMEQQAEQEPDPDELRERELADLDRFLAAELLRLSEEDPLRFEKQWQQVRTIPGVVAALENLIADQERQAVAEAEREYAMHDPGRDESAWLDDVARAAIAKEDREREFVEPRPAPAAPAREEQARAGQPKKDQQPRPANVKGAAAHFREALQHSDSPEAFMLDLAERKIMLACASRLEAHQSRARGSYARQFGNFAPEYAEGEIVAVTYQGHVYKLSERNTGKSREDMAAFLEPLDRRTMQGIEATIAVQNRARQDRNETHWPVMGQQPERQPSATGLKMQDAPTTSPAPHFQDAARQTHKPEAAPVMPADLRGCAAEIWTAYNTRAIDREWQRENADGTKETVRDRIRITGGRDPLKFGQALDERGLILARATKEEEDHSREFSPYWKAWGEYQPTFREGEFAVIDRRGEVWKLTERTTGHSAKEVQAFLNKGDWKALPGIEAGRQIMNARTDERLTQARDRAAHWDAIRLKNATRKHGGRSNGRVAASSDLARPLGITARVSGRALGALGTLGKLADGFSLDALTPKEKYEAAKRDARNEREADTNADYAAYMAALAEQRRRDQQRQAEQRQNEPEPHPERQR